MFLHCNSEFSLISLYFFLINQVLHCQTMLISNYNLITITYMYSELYCFSHPTNHQHVAV